MQLAHRQSIVARHIESFIYDGDAKRVGWYDGAGALKAQFTFGTRLQVPELMIKAGASYRFITDQIGSVRMVLDATGSILERIDYDEFGNVENDTAPGFQPFGFAGGLRDLDVDLVRFGLRDY